MTAATFHCFEPASPFLGSRPLKASPISSFYSPSRPTLLLCSSLPPAFPHTAGCSVACPFWSRRQALPTSAGTGTHASPAPNVPSSLTSALCPGRRKRTSAPTTRLPPPPGTRSRGTGRTEFPPGYRLPNLRRSPGSAAPDLPRSSRVPTARGEHTNNSFHVRQLPDRADPGLHGDGMCFTCSHLLFGSAASQSSTEPLQSSLPGTASEGHPWNKDSLLPLQLPLLTLSLHTDTSRSKIHQRKWKFVPNLALRPGQCQHETPAGRFPVSKQKHLPQQGGLGTLPCS